MASVKTEYEVERIFIEQLEDLGYQYIDMANYDDVTANFRVQFCKVNAKALIEAKGVTELSDSEFAKIMLRLDNHTIYESAKILREKWVLELDDGKTIYVQFLTDDMDRNTYQVTHQVTMDKAHKDDVEYKNRYDVTVLINGLPLVQIELKRSGVELNEAVNQINRYRAYSFKGLLRYIQVFVVSNSVQTKYFANANERKPDGTEQLILKSLAFYWTDRDNTRINRLGEFTDVFFDKYSVTEMLTKFMVIKESEPVIMVMRPYQIYAVKESMERILGSNLNGYVFHTTGSGKTLTSYKLASLLRDNPNIDKVFFLIDRKDLDDQTVDEYNSFEAGCVDNTDSTKQLVDDLSDSSKTLVITTIQKMANAIKSERYAKVMDSLADKKCVFIIDECHRSQFGKMHGDIKRHFQRANYIGFTGTPIFKENKGANSRTTADMFFSGTLDPCIHRYMIKEAIADGNVLRFSVEYMRSLNASKVSIEGFDPKKIDDPEYCKRMNVDMDSLYHDSERISMIADNILETLDAHIKPTGKDVYTALFAVDKIQTLMDYYHAFKAKNSKGYKICAIFTFQPNEDLSEGQDEHSARYLQECMDDYNAMFGTGYDLSTFDAYRKDIAKRLKQKDIPQVDLLIVVAKDDRGINLAKSSLAEISFNQTSFDIFHNSEEEYNHQISVYFDAIDHAKQHGDFETYVSVSCLLVKLFMEYGEYGSAERQIASLTEYMDINISIGSKVRFQEIKAEWYIRHNMEEECLNEIEEAFHMLEKSGDDIYLKRNLCLRAVMLLGHSVKNLDYIKNCLVLLKDSKEVNTIDRYYDEIPVDEAISLADEKKSIFRNPVFFAIGEDYLKEKSKVIRAAIVRATFYNDEEMLVLLFERLVFECMHKIDIVDVCRICFAYVEASKRLIGGIYKYESTYTLISCLQMSELDADGKISLQYIDDVLNSDDLDQPEYNEIVGRLYESKSLRLLFRGDYSESEKCYVAARDKLCHYEGLWDIFVKERVDSLIQLNCQDRVINTLRLSYPQKSEDEIEAIYRIISDYMDRNMTEFLTGDEL